MLHLVPIICFQIILLQNSIFGEPVCRTGWTESPHKKTCIRISHDRKLPWEDARAQCKAEGADLVIILDESMDDFITAQLSAYQNETF
ncbi:hypothetical protein RRG08_007878 [Elysia crispata]|uniref:C-type lectin domain-containing protein n=1 Tax=Elysia crispata TaxID=231223 RepID=A0AAE0XWZ4_9GAST|nr:hypothetical protein RRG08_007878 [Elysia crispata]